MPRPRQTTRLGWLLASCLVAAGCGGRGRALDGVGAAPSEVLVEVLPRSSEVRLDGRPLGRGGGAVPAPPPAAAHVLVVAAEGYEPVERTLPEGDLAGARVAEALRPLGFAAAGALDYDEPRGLSLAAAFLAAQGNPADAAAYAERAVTLDPALPLPHRTLGDSAWAVGDRRRAIAEWSEYLRLAPGAEDAARVAGQVDAAREAASR